MACTITCTGTLFTSRSLCETLWPWTPTFQPHPITMDPSKSGARLPPLLTKEGCVRRLLGSLRWRAGNTMPCGRISLRVSICAISSRFKVWETTRPTVILKTRAFRGRIISQYLDRRTFRMPKVLEFWICANTLKRTIRES